MRLKLVPKSLAGRLTLLLLLVLIIAQGVAMALFVHERIEAVRHTHQDNVILRTATVARLLRDTPPALHEAIVVATTTDFLRFSLTDIPLIGQTGNGVRVTTIAARLSVALETGQDQVRVALMRNRHLNHGDADDEVRHNRHRRDGDHDHGPRHRRPVWFTASVALHDGRWLNVEVGPPPGAPPWGSTFMLSFMLSVLGIAAVAVLTGRRIAKPMRRLAAAAGKLGRGEMVEDLPEAGPMEIRDTVRAFNIMRERLDRFVRDRTTMLAAVSHDLRTPITSLRLNAEIIENEEVRAKIIAALDEMQRMTEDTLTFIREDMQREGTRTVDIHALVDSVAMDLADLGQNIEVAQCDRILIACRSVALRRALRNLFENACGYGDRATVRIVEDASQVRIVVEDEGPGIAKADLDRVFEPFVRLETSRSPKTGGTGLGLAIARSIVRSHGGDIRLAVRETGGLRATVILPATGQG